jgi:hypothetical protein
MRTGLKWDLSIAKQERATDLVAKFPPAPYLDISLCCTTAIQCSIVTINGKSLTPKPVSTCV